MVALKRMRTKAGVVLSLLCLAWGVLSGMQPFDLREPNRWVTLGLILVGVGLTVRLAAYGSIRKKEELATKGVYSLCRHPLYLGSILMTYGFCTLLDNRNNFIVATAYFIIFYPLAIAWDEIRLGERYADAHREYALTTPVLLPVGRYRANKFHWALAAKNGGASLIAMTTILLIVTETLAVLLRRVSIRI